MFCWLQALSVTSFLLALYAVTSLASPDHTPTLYPGTEYWAEVAGLMVTLPSQHPERLEAAAAASTPASASASARHVLVVNEYRGSQLIRQSAAVRESSSPDNMTSGLNMLLKIPETQDIEGTLDISSMHEILNAHSMSEQLETDDIRRVLSETLSFQFISATRFKHFSFLFLSDRRDSRSVSDVRRANPREWTCQPARDLIRNEDCLWTPIDTNERRVLPYVWNGEYSPMDEVWKRKKKV